MTGGLGSGKEHRQVQEDIERADARALAAILNRDLIRPWMDLEFGPLARYPRLKIERPEADDLAAMATSLGTLVPLGLKVKMAEVREKFGWSDPGPDDEVLTASAAAAPPVTDPLTPDVKIKRVSGEIKRGAALPGPITALQAKGPPAVV